MTGVPPRGKCWTAVFWRKQKPEIVRKEWGDYYETDIIVCRGSRDFIRQQYRAGSRIACAGCIRAAGFLRGVCLYAALHFVFYLSSFTGSLSFAAAVLVQPAPFEKDGKRLTVKARKITI